MIKRILAYFIFITTSMVIMSVTAFAADPIDASCSTDKAKKFSSVCQSRTNDDPLTGADGLIVNIAEIVSFVAGAAAIIMLIYAGIQYITSGGDPGNAKNARNTLLYALIGVAIVILARILVIYLVKL